MKLSKELLSDILDRVVVRPALAPAARSVGINPATLFRYIQRSDAGDPEFILKWADYTDQFANHLKLAAKMNIAILESQVRETVSEGFQERVVFQGKAMFEQDERCVGEDPALWDILGYPADGLKRDEYGNLVPLYIRRAPSSQVLLRVLSAHLKNYRDTTTQNVNVAGGVVVIPGKSNPNEPRRVAGPKSEPIDADFTSLEDNAPAEGECGAGVIVVEATEPMPTADYEKDFGGKRIIEPVEFDEDVDAAEQAAHIAFPGQVKRPDAPQPLGRIETKEERLARLDAEDLAAAGIVPTEPPPPAPPPVTTAPGRAAPNGVDGDGNPTFPDRAARAARMNAEVAAAVKNPRPHVAGGQPRPGPNATASLPVPGIGRDRPDDPPEHIGTGGRDKA
ncbi:MAG TPA: hypothetical protein VIJ52_00700 [Pseudolabrys sp.]